MSAKSHLSLVLLTALATFMIPAIGFAATINLYDAPNDTAKVTGNIDLSAGVIPIYTPQNSAWVKVGDPRNGNTGWVKSSELKDSNGNAITFSQKVTDTGKGTTQSMQMNIGNPPPTPASAQQAQQIQQNATAESMKQAGQALELIKQSYEKTMELMQNAGFPKVQNVTAPNQPAAGQQGTGTAPTK